MSDQPKIIAGSMRPDGTMRKEIKVRPGYVPQDEVQRYTNSRLEAQRPKPGYVPGAAPKDTSTSTTSNNEAKSKTALKNAKKRANKAASKAESGADEEEDVQAAAEGERSHDITSKATPPVAVSSSSSGTSEADLEKKLRGLNKKHRQILDLAGRPASELLPEQQEKLSKRKEVEDEIKELEEALAKLKTA